MSQVDVAERLVAVAGRLLTYDRREWAEAMQAELATLAEAPERRRFALGCLSASIGLAQLVWLVKYTLLVVAALALAHITAMSAAVRIELVVLALAVPLVIARLTSGDRRLSTIGAPPAARVVRSTSLWLAAAGMGVAAGFLSSLVPPEGQPVLVVALFVLVLVLAAYCRLALALTATESGLKTPALAATGAIGVAAGLAWCVLMPFDTNVAVPGSGLRFAYAAGLSALIIGAPAVVAAMTERQRQATMAGAGTGVVAGLVILVGGPGTVWAAPWLLDTSLFDNGPQWRPPDVVEQVVPSYLWVLLLAPTIGAAVGWLVGQFKAQAGDSPRWGPRAASASGIAALGLLAIPFLSQVDHDPTTFGIVGTTNVVFSPAGSTLVTANADYTWILWDISDASRPSRLLTFNDQVLYSPDGRVLVSRNQLWSLADPTHPVRLAGFRGGEPLAFTTDGRTLATHDRDSTVLWNIADIHQPRRIASVTAGHEALFSPDGHTLFTRDEQAAVIWSLIEPSRPVAVARIPDAGVWVLSPDGRTLAIAAWQHPVRVWNVSEPALPRLAATLPDDHGDKLAFAPDSRVLASARGDGSIWLWSAPGARPLAALPAPGPFRDQIGASSTLTTVAFTPDGHTLASVAGNVIATRWDVTDPSAPIKRALLTRESNGPGVVGFSPDTSTVAGAAIDRTNSITLWRVA